MILRFGFILSFLIAFAGHSQKAEITIGAPSILIGEQTTLHISFEYENPTKEALIAWPDFGDKLTSDVEIADKTVDHESIIDSANNVYLREQTLIITSFSPGIQYIPPVEIELNDTVYRTNSLDIQVNLVEIDTTQGVYDNFPNFQVDYTWSERASEWFSAYWYWFAIGGGLVALFFLFKLWKSKQPEAEEPPAPKIPAHITALASLIALKDQEGWKSDDRKAYYSRLTNTVRLYLEERFEIYAMEQTTREIILNLKQADISEEDKEYLRKILMQADMVKFAKFSPNEEDGLTLLDRSIDFVERTKEEIESDNDTEEISPIE